MSAPPARFLALGDSYTIGEGVRADERWPGRLAAELRLRGAEIATPDIVARTGWTCAELAAGIGAAAPTGPFDLVSLLAGVNDQYRGGSPDDYARAFAGLVDAAVAFAGGRAGRVLVLSIPDWSVTPFAEGRDRAALAAEIARFNAANRAAAAAVGARYVDVTPDSRRAAGDPSLLADDGLHPGARMHATWARLALPAAQAALATA